MKRPTLRMIAKAANVCPMTVSLALRNHAKISLKTRSRVRRWARRLGYRPDPLVAKLMAHLRTGRNSSANLAALMASAETFAYPEEVFRGAAACAERHGYALEAIRVGARESDRRTVRRTIGHRGVEGIIICPLVPSDTFADLLDWEKFSVVATSYAWTSPLFTRVVPDGFGNTLEACLRLSEAGFRRIGLVLTRHLDALVRHHFSAAVVWHGAYGNAEIVPALLFDAEPETEAIVEWCDRHRPDVILAAVAGHTQLCRECLERAGRRPPVTVCLSETEDPKRPCILQQPARIGEAAMNLLAGMLLRGERGMPIQPLTVQVPGVWREGNLQTNPPRRS